MKEDRGQETLCTDLMPYFAGNELDGVLTGIWLKKNKERNELIRNELILKFDEHITKPGKAVYMELIAEKLIDGTMQEKDDRFREMVDGLRIRQWEPTDEEWIQCGITHITPDNKTVHRKE